MYFAERLQSSASLRAYGWFGCGAGLLALLLAGCGPVEPPKISALPDKHEPAVAEAVVEREEPAVAEAVVEREAPGVARELPAPVARPTILPELIFSAAAIRPVADHDAAAVRSWASAHGGVYVWDTMNSNRRNCSGVIFHVNRPATEPFRVRVKFAATSATGDFRDGAPAEFVLRLFDDTDRSVMAVPLGQEVAGWHEFEMNLDAVPEGRYRLSFVGYHEGLAVSTSPASAIGVAGGASLGLHGVGEYYFWVPEDAALWRILAATPDAGQSLRFYDAAGNLVREQDLPAVPVASFETFERIDFQESPDDQVWRLKHVGGGRLRLNFLGDVLGILWPDAESAREAGRRAARVGHWRIVHAWQRPLAEWLASRTPNDFHVAEREWPGLTPELLPDHVAIRLDNARGELALGVSLLRHNQITDPASPAVGLFSGPAPEGEPVPGTARRPAEPGHVRAALYRDIPRISGLHVNAAHSHMGYVQGIANLYDFAAGGVNPYHRDPAVAARAAAGLFQILLSVPPEQFVTLDFVTIRRVAVLAATILPYLPEELAEPVRAGLIETYGRVAYYDAYVSNQGANIIAGVKLAADLTGDAELKRYYERRLTAFLSDHMTSNNHGQSPSGYFQERGGFDAAYNTYTATLMASLWHYTQDPRFYRALERTWELIRHMTVRQPDGTFDSARAWNTRTDSCAWTWHRQRAGVSIPGVATFWGAAIDYDGTTPWDLATRAREQLRKRWHEIPGPELDLSKWWTGNATESYEFAAPYAMPLRLPCDEPAPFLRVFGKDNDRNFMFARRGPWYLVLYGGGSMPWGGGDSGSSLATLWHERFGTLIKGDTRLYKAQVENRRKNGEELFLTFTDAWAFPAGNHPARRVSSEISAAAFAVPGDIPGKLMATITPRRPKEPEWVLRRSFILGDHHFETSVASGDGGELAEHILYLPLVCGKDTTLTALDESGQPVRLDQVGDTATLAGWRWTRHDADGKEISLTLRFAAPVENELLLRHGTISFLRVRLAGKANRLIIGRPGSRRPAGGNHRHSGR